MRVGILSPFFLINLKEDKGITMSEFKSDVTVLINKKVFSSVDGQFISHTILCKVEGDCKELRIKRAFSYKCSCDRYRCGCTHVVVDKAISGKNGSIFLVDVRCIQNV